VPVALPELVAPPVLVAPPDPLLDAGGAPSFAVGVASSDEQLARQSAAALVRTSHARTMEGLMRENRWCPRVKFVEISCALIGIHAAGVIFRQAETDAAA
jgi:hypothetical protein